MSAARKLTADELFQLGDDIRAELIDGVILPKAMSGPGHGHPQTRLATWLRRFDRKPGGRWPGGWKIYTEVHVVYADDQVYCHDLSGWLLDRAPLPTRTWPTIRPDWACEILSPGHEKRDRVDKLATLQAAGVPHYWLLDCEQRRLLTYRLVGDSYAVREVAATDVLRLEPFAQVELRAGVIFGDEDDEE